MSQREKLRKRFFKKPIPNDITYEELETLAKGYGLIVVPGGKHPMKIVHRESGTVIPIPVHGKTVDEAYIKEVKRLLAEIGI